MSQDRERKDGPSSAGVFSKPASSTFQWNSLHPRLQQLALSFLDHQTLLILARSGNKAGYYPILKKGLVRLLKQIVNADDTQNAKLLKTNLPPQMSASLLLREDDPRDPHNRAYMGILTTPWQDAWPDPFQEEMRSALLGFFPEDKRSEADRQADDIMTKPEFEPLRRLQEIAIKTHLAFAYETYFDKYEEWKKSGFKDPLLQRAARDAWMRVELALDLCSKRLRRIFSSVGIGMEQKRFQKIPQDQDLPEPQFYGDPNDLWLPSTVKRGCDLILTPAPFGADVAEKSVAEEKFQTRLNELSGADGYPVLIRCEGGKEKASCYYLYAPCIRLDRDQVEWRTVLIDDPKVVALIEGRGPGEAGKNTAINFNSGKLAYSPKLDALYHFGAARHSLHMGSGYSFIFSTVNYSGWPFPHRAGSAPRGRAAANFAAVTALYEERVQNRAKLLEELARYRPTQNKRGPGGPS